jgi:spore coat polysaccharide biosynthesis protein SpsF (cytidylyltransferase family)
VLSEAAAKPLLAYVVERVRRATLIDELLVATSDDPSDDAVASFCRAAGVNCHRGSLDDVAGRILGAVRAHGLDAFVRISGDSPLLDQSLVDRAVALLRDAGSDVATNVYPTRTFPHGQSVEAIRTEAFERGYALAADAADLEHVTPAFYRHADEFVIASFMHDPDLGNVQLAVDTEADLDTFGDVLAAMSRPHWDYGLDEVLELHRACVA